jgi:DNA-binding transcriptional MerR regulator
MAAKSATAFRTISEVANELELPQHVLRFWETKFRPVRPLKRAGGRRYYRPEDIVLLRKIRDLLYNDGYTIKGVQKLLRDGGAIENSPAPEITQPSPMNETSNNLSSEIGNIDELRSIVTELEELRDLLAR